MALKKLVNFIWLLVFNNLPNDVFCISFVLNFKKLHDKNYVK
jgi:hypothetical protein